MDGCRRRWGCMASPEEHLIYIADAAASRSGSGESVGTRSDEEEDGSLPSKPHGDEEWIREVENKMCRALLDSMLWPFQSPDERETTICKFTLGKEISRPRFATIGEFSQPRVVTIGPFHRQESTSISDDQKWVIVCFMNLLCGLDLARCLVKMKEEAKKARNSYSDLDISQSSGPKDYTSFTEMLLLDSYFILFILTVKIRKRPAGYTLMPPTPDSANPLKLFRDDATKFLDIIFNKDEIALDLLILDNQIPFFVIEELFKELKLDKPLLEYALEFFEMIHPRSARHFIDENISPPKFLHLLDLFHWSRVPQNKYIEPIISSSSKQLDSIYWAPYTPNAMELRESATMFEKKTSGSSSLDITFRRRWFKHIIGVLDIPELHIRDYSSFIFHNLIAFEMQSSSRGRCTVAFSALMRNFLQREEDVKLLRQRGILVSSSMTDRQLIDLFARLSRLTENHQMPSDLFNICHQVLSHHNHPVNQFCGSVIIRYFPSPLVTLSVSAAAVLFVLSLLQTIYAMISYHHLG
ncbi:UPF0481 protein At3g47200-like [Ananas comosus]|uniref:UPF0481 protein At3g47200-like n=1 Tax=Ananas comosus TaxID=4615 RepID=A0A6P5EF90_ANACO|nr:UPF0481 protein At3g47200-like [Ananas comosus]XP_020111124.1 UPF0481 protein At3g47200-like [Ananas comosus]XP_020111125.1 UPF0481 protein At3g47200-like [Ananas comosus]